MSLRNHTHHRSPWRGLLCLIGAVALLTVGQSTPNTPTKTAAGAQPGPAITYPGAVSGARVAIIPITGDIQPFVLESLQRRTDDAMANGATWIVYELDTYGGELTTALETSKYIKALPVPTLAWVNNKAYSAGSLIAAACNGIVMSPASAMGDCAPIIPGVSMAPTERAKRLSPLLAEFRDSARQNGYDFALFQAYCVLGIEVYEVKNKDTGQVRYVNQADYKVMVQNEDPASITTATNPDTRPLEPGLDLGTDQERGKWELVRRVHDGNTLLTLHQDEAHGIGLCINDPHKTPLANDQNLSAYLMAQSVTRMPQHWTVGVAYFLCQQWVRAILFLLMLIGGYLEAHAPGMSVPGLVAFVSLVLLVVAPFLVGIGEVWHLVLLALGVVLLGVELFVIPGFGIVGVSGIVAIFVSLVLMAIPTTNSGWLPLPAAGTAGLVRESFAWFVVAMMLAGVAFYFITKHFGSLPMLNRLVLQSPRPRMAVSSTGELVNIPDEPSTLSGQEVVGSGWVKVGMVGRSATMLRPSGRIDIDGRVVDAVSIGNWIEPGKTVRVTEVTGNRVVVDHNE
ncbi:MAG: hypothetical protein GC164_08870 [Phycisphaera sp.]|nr:hypothetical protein [Phycisphaera sp.]